MKQFIILLVFFAGILFFQPLTAQTSDSAQVQTEQLNQQEKNTDNSVILITNNREKPFSIVTLFRGLLGMAVLLFIGFILSNNRPNIPWRTVIIGLTIQIILAIGVLYVPFIRSG